MPVECNGLEPRDNRAEVKGVDFFGLAVSGKSTTTDSQARFPTGYKNGGLEIHRPEIHRPVEMIVGP